MHTSNTCCLFQSSLKIATEAWGVTVERVEVKDVRVPENLQRAMAAEAEAAREARAKVSTSWIILLLWSSPFFYGRHEKRQ